MMEFLKLVEVYPQVEYRLLHNFLGDVHRKVWCLTSENNQQRTKFDVQVTSALPLKADSQRTLRHVC
jgi:hypothetical protein